MYSKIKIAGHPVHPMLIAFPVTLLYRHAGGFRGLRHDRPPVLA